MAAIRTEQRAFRQELATAERELQGLQCERSPWKRPDGTRLRQTWMDMAAEGHIHACDAVAARARGTAAPDGARFIAADLGLLRDGGLALGDESYWCGSEEAEQLRSELQRYTEAGIEQLQDEPSVLDAFVGKCLDTWVRKAEAWKGPSAVEIFGPLCETAPDDGYKVVGQKRRLYKEVGARACLCAPFASQGVLVEVDETALAPRSADPLVTWAAREALDQKRRALCFELLREQQRLRVAVRERGASGECGDDIDEDSPDSAAMLESNASYLSGYVGTLRPVFRGHEIESPVQKRLTEEIDAANEQMRALLAKEAVQAPLAPTVLAEETKAQLAARAKLGRASLRKLDSEIVRHVQNGGTAKEPQENAIDMKLHPYRYI